MKKTISLMLVAMFAIAMVITGCKKYDEGPTMSLASKKGRVVGQWQLEQVLYNGIAQPVDPDWANETMEYKKDNTWTYTNPSGSMSGTWDFGDKKETIISTFTFSGISSSDTTTIIRLKSKEFWTKDVSGTDTYEYHYKAK